MALITCQPAARVKDRGLDVHLPTLDPPTAEALVAEAHTVYPYSNATLGNIDVVLTVV